MYQVWRSTTNNLRQQSKQKSSLRQVEDSVTFRFLVLGLVISGVVATDIAAETTFSFWAIPLSICGTIWSYYRRRQGNIPTQFCIAIGMLVALGAFFSQLLGQLNDTRLTLAELLIQLQVLHSFDTPRRKDLGYSIVIGLILIGVAATLSETMAFAPVLLLFLAIALPTLVLDYRSQLGLESSNRGKTRAKNTTRWEIKSLILSFLVILSLGLGIFAILPRFPGYQFKTFPVSAHIDVKGNITGRKIINRGYTRQGKGEHGTGTTKNGTPGKIDHDSYYGFNSQMNQNLRGELVSKVVMRVRSQVEGFWRVLAFDHYTGKGWEISHNQDTALFKQPALSYKISLPTPLIIGKTQEVIQTYTVVAENLPNVIPALAYAKEIYFPTPLISMDRENGLRSPVELSENMTYTVVSDVAYRDKNLLSKAGEKYPAQIRQSYLQIPPEIAAKIRLRTQEILAKYDQERVSKSSDRKTLNSPYEKALYLAQYLKQNYSIPQNPADLPYLNEHDDLATTFLFKQHGGYPDHFSTVFTVMLRSIGIPARLVVGFAPGQFNPFTGMYIVRNTDAYAMTEVYFPKYGWFTFDPIPHHPLIPPSIENIETFSVLHQFWSWVAGWLPTPVSSLFERIFGTIFKWIIEAIAWFFGLFSQGWLGILTGLLIATIASFCGWLSWKQWQYLLNRLWLHKLHPMDRLYQQMLQWTSQKGLNKHPAQTPLEYAQVSSQKYPRATAQVIDEISQAYVSWRYGGGSPDWKKLQQRWDRIKQKTRG